jgi:hypothetical protein
MMIARCTPVSEPRWILGMSGFTLRSSADILLLLSFERSRD